jgi:hypothetical protein
MEGVKNSSGTMVDGGAADQQPPPDPELAPYGWMRDPKTQEWRPRKRAGRAGKSAAATPASGVDVDSGQEQDPEEGSPPPGRDPEPARMSGAVGPEPSGPPQVSRETENDIAGMVALLYSVPADFLVMRDPYCFGVLNQSLDSVIKATVPIICRSQLAVDFVTGKQGLILYIKLAVALRPFLTALWAHHVTHTVSLKQDEEGHAVVEREDWSAYTAA